jgi:hypothetical protein
MLVVASVELLSAIAEDAAGTALGSGAMDCAEAAREKESIASAADRHTLRGKGVTIAIRTIAD